MSKEYDPDSPAARIAADGDARQARVRAADGPRYGRGNRYERVESPPMEADAERPSRSKVHSILSALPIIMLVTGLYSYYRGETEQSAGAPIRAESVSADGVFEGLSTVKSGGEGRHYLWFDDGERTRGARLSASHREAVESLQQGDLVNLQLAPTVSGSKTLWVWRVEHDGDRLLDDAERLR